MREILRLEGHKLESFYIGQNTVESSTFGSELVAMRVASELIISLRYKFWMFGIPVEGPCNVFCDNEAVYKNTSFAESTIKKKHNSICFHRVWECVASDILCVHKVDTNYNLSDILTKSLPAVKKKELRGRIMFTEYTSPLNWISTISLNYHFLKSWRVMKSQCTNRIGGETPMG